MQHNILAVGGQKGGTAKSTTAQLVAVEAANAGDQVILADLDRGQGSSVRWGNRRKDLGLKPEIDVRLTSQRQVWELSALCSLLVIDAPGYADVSTLELAERSNLLVLTTGTNLIELEPTVLLMRELMSRGIKEEKVAIALVKVIDREREREAREYLKAANMHASEPSLQWFKSTHDIAAEGRAVTESPNRAVAAQGAAFFGGLAGALDRVVEPEKHKRRLEQAAEAEASRNDRDGIERE